MSQLSPRQLLAIIGPGILIAATGVGAGDLATASLTGSRLGVTVLWVVLLGAFFKFVLNEGLARWQLATGQTLLEGAVRRLGFPVILVFMPYLLLWTYFVGAALVSACGVAGHAMMPVFDNPEHGRIFFGILHSILGFGIAWGGGFKLFNDVMHVLIAIMFVTVLAAAALVQPDWSAVLRGLVPTLPNLKPETITWSAALMGGVGGTVTVLCYGYWIREVGRTGVSDLRTCRIDLVFGYLFTAMFGLSMVIIGSTLDLHDGKGAMLIVALADQLQRAVHPSVGPALKWAFMIGAWAAFFTSVLGVWQAVPYLFADFVNIARAGKTGTIAPVDRSSGAYRGYLVFISTVPLIGLFFSFREVQKFYSLFGAYFMPMLALVLLLMTVRRDWIGERFVSRWPTRIVLVVILIVFGLMGWLGIGE